MAHRVESVVWRNITFRRYPDSPRWSDRNYFRPGGQHIQRGVESLHREIWKAHHGAIPDGYDVHHRDCDTGNNDVSNYELVSRSAHRPTFHPIPDAVRLGLRRQLDRVRPLAAAWHRSDEGLAWHREHAQHSIVGRAPVEYTCTQCGATFQAPKSSGTRFCSNKCKSKWRRDAGLDNVKKPCERCGTPFVSNRYDKVRFCSRSCAMRTARAARARVQPDGS